MPLDESRRTRSAWRAFVGALGAHSDNTEIGAGVTLLDRKGGGLGLDAHRSRKHTSVSRFEFWAEMRNQEVDFRLRSEWTVARPNPMLKHSWVEDYPQLNRTLGPYEIVKGKDERVFVTGNFSDIGSLLRMLIETPQGGRLG